MPTDDRELNQQFITQCHGTSTGNSMLLLSRSLCNISNINTDFIHAPKLAAISDFCLGGPENRKVKSDSTDKLAG